MLERLNALNPLSVLERGYGALRSEEGRMISSVTGLSEGQRVQILLRDGHADAQIVSVSHTEAQNGKETKL
jgi:exodeoxyribonuclease VII large subunit